MGRDNARQEDAFSPLCERPTETEAVRTRRDSETSGRVEKGGVECAREMRTRNISGLVDNPACCRALAELTKATSRAESRAALCTASWRARVTDWT